MQLHKPMNKPTRLFLAGTESGATRTVSRLASPPSSRSTDANPEGGRLKLAPADHGPGEYHLENRLAETIDGPMPLEARCPKEWCVRLILDGAGRIHIWRANVDHDAHAGVISLINARFWVRENMKLIAMTQPECKFDLDAEPMLHLFTTDAAKGTPMIGMLGPFLMVHVLSPQSRSGMSDLGHRRQPA